MNDACPAQQHEAAYVRPELFERRQRRMNSCTAVPFLPIWARFYSFKLPLFAAPETQQTLIYLTLITNPQSRRFRRPFPIRGSKRRAC